MTSPANDNVPQMPPDNAPLRLVDAIRFAFPAGGMTVSGLRQEYSKGRLNLELIAGKHFVTLAAIREMRELCRVEAQGRACGGTKQDNRGPSPTAANVSAQDVARAKIRKLRGL